MTTELRKKARVTLQCKVTSHSTEQWKKVRALIEDELQERIRNEELSFVWAAIHSSGCPYPVTISVSADAYCIGTALREAFCVRKLFCPERFHEAGVVLHSVELSGDYLSHRSELLELVRCIVSNTPIHELPAQAA